LYYVTATRIAVYVGRAMAILFAFWGMFGGGIFLLFVAFFVYVGGGAEREAVEHRAILRNIPVTRALMPTEITLFTSEWIGRAVDLVMQNHQSDYPVRNLGGDFVGVLTRPMLVKALREEGREARVVDVMTPLQHIPICTINDDLSIVWEQMMQTNSRVVAIMENGKLLGLITLDNISEVVQIIGAANNRITRQNDGQSFGGHNSAGPRGNDRLGSDQAKDDRSSSVL
jgi:CBS domain-containing protein